MSRFLVASIAVGVVACLAPATAEEVVRFKTEDDVEIVGAYHLPAHDAVPAPAALLLHMYRSNRSSWDPLIPHLQRAGFAVLAIDLRGHGASGGAEAETFSRRAAQRDPAVFHDMHYDVEAARRWLATRKEVDQARVALIAASVGCSLAFAYAAEDRSVDVVAAMSPGTGYFGMDSTVPMMTIGQRPVLLTATEYERKACDHLSRFNPHATKKIIGKMTAHGTRMFDALDGIEAMITKFVREGVGKPSREPVVALGTGDVFYPDAAALQGAVGKTDPAELRWYSSAAEAEKRGLRRAGAEP